MIYESMRKEFCVLGKRRRKKKESLTRIYGKSWEFNMLYYVEYSQSARKALRKLDKQTARIIKYWIEKNLINTDNPRIHGKELKGNLKGLWRYRVGDYRLIEIGRASCRERV